MARDSLFGERIVWQGRCRAVSVPFAQKVMAVGGQLSFRRSRSATPSSSPRRSTCPSAEWSSSRAGARRSRSARGDCLSGGGPSSSTSSRTGTSSGAAGRIRRSIEINQISYALVRWSTHDASTGDLVLIRAVPTGALRRTLSLTLHDVEGPDRLWAIIRGVEPSAPLGSGDRPLGAAARRRRAGPLVGAPLARRPGRRSVRSTAASGAVLALMFERSMASSVPSLGAAAPDARSRARTRGPARGRGGSRDVAAPGDLGGRGIRRARAALAASRARRATS